MLRQSAILLLTIAIALLTAMAQAETLGVRLVLSDSTAPYQRFSSALNKALAANNANVSVIESQTGSEADARLVVAVGMKAMELAVAKYDAPVLSVMITRMGYEVLTESRSAKHRSKAISAIYLDQPWDRQLSFISAVLPRHKTVGLLYSSDTRITLPRLPRGMSLNAQSTSVENLFAALERVLSNSDVLLVVPDNEIYSSSNVRNILLTSYRYKIPVIGISQSYVNAGALGAVFSTPEQIASQTAEVIISFSRNGQLPEPQYPVQFNVDINQQVAHSLGIAPGSPIAIHERMDKAEEDGK